MPIHYASKTMTEAQAHYTTTEKELLAVVYAFEKFRSYLVLSKSIVYTDHSAIKYLFAKKDAKPRLRYKVSTSKESSKGKSPAKTSKSGKYVTTEEPVKMASDDIEQIVDDVVTDVYQILDNLTQTKDKAQKKDRFKQPPRPPTPDLEWNKRQVVDDQSEQPWFNNMVSAAKDPLTLDELMATLIDFSKYAMNRLKIDNLTQAHLVGLVYGLLKGTCKSNIELEYNMEECFKALIDKLDLNIPERYRYPFDLTKPLPLNGRPCHLTIVVEYFFNNDLEFLKSSDPEKKYTTSITKTKVARYKIVGIKDMIPTL
ncbi:retrovirus-related pol polyprotein from transposon TNT 1-94 [Tanacetum coccineum]